MSIGPVILLYAVFWLVVVPIGLYLIVRTAVEHGIRRAQRQIAPEIVAAVERNRTEDR